MEEVLDELWRKRHQQDILFLELIDGYKIIKTKKFNGINAYLVNNKIIFCENVNTKYIWINHELIWIVFKKQFNMDDNETYLSFKYLFDKYLNMRHYSITKENILISIIESYIINGR